MAKSKKKLEIIMPMEDDEVFGIGDSEGFYDEDGMIDESVGPTGELKYNAKTLMLPSGDITMSYLLDRESKGEITIIRKDLFPMKEGYILAYVEYKVLD